MDVNSRYAYFLLCGHFGPTSVVAEDDGAIVGFIGGYRPPTDPDQLFVWQIATRADKRGQAVGDRMADHILARPSCAGVRYLGATVTPSNQASRRFFEGFARAKGVDCAEEPFLRADQFGADAHEEEILLKIGPFGS